MPDRNEAAAAVEKELRRQAALYPRLTDEHESVLLGDRSLENSQELVRHNLDLVAEQAEAHAGRGLSFGDLYQEGAVGLLDAVGAYDGRGSFRQFASLHIGLQMDALLEVEAEELRAEALVVEDARVLDLAQVMFRKKNGRDATEVEMAEILEWDAARVKRMTAMLDDARSLNDQATANAIDLATDTLAELDFEEPEKDPRRRPGGHGPDD
ncbi:MAG: sigma factor [Candidatus Dormibacteria bacterium]